jgi:hypothetical protein
MSKQLSLPRPAWSAMKRAAPLAALLAAALVLVPAAASGTYGDATGDAIGGAGDITGVTVMGDKGSGQLVFRITGSNLASSSDNIVSLDVDSDANPLTGNVNDDGMDYSFTVDNDTYSFERWSGAEWVDTPYSTVHVSGGASGIAISLNRSELGNASVLNFEASTLAIKIVGTTAQIGADFAPDDGVFNYSLEANGPRIDSVDVQTTPVAGPKAGKKFVVTPTALKLPPDGRTSQTPILPESYSCTAKLGARTLVGTGTGSCTFSIPKKKARGKKLAVALTVNYQGATKTVPFTFKVT